LDAHDRPSLKISQLFWALIFELNLGQ